VHTGMQVLPWMRHYCTAAAVGHANTYLRTLRKQKIAV
jgi:hypothetical protein